MNNAVSTKLSRELGRPHKGSRFQSSGSGVQDGGRRATILGWQRADALEPLLDKSGIIVQCHLRFTAVNGDRTGSKMGNSGHRIQMEERPFHGVPRRELYD